MRIAGGDWRGRNLRVPSGDAVRPTQDRVREALFSMLQFELADTSDFSRSGCRDMVMAMSRDGYMGKGRAAAVLANVIAPFALAEGRIGEVPDWLPPEDVSSPVRLTAFRLFGRDHNPSAHYANNGLLIQGLLQIHREFCLRLHPDCGRCEIGENSDKK